MNKIILSVLILLTPLGYTKADTPNGLYKADIDADSVNLSVCINDEHVKVVYTKYSGEVFEFENKSNSVVDDLVIFNVIEKNRREIKVVYAYRSRSKALLGSIYLYDGFEVISVIPFLIKKVDENCES